MDSAAGSGGFRKIFGRAQDYWGAGVPSKGVSSGRESAAPGHQTSQLACNKKGSPGYRAALIRRSVGLTEKDYWMTFRR